MNILYLTNHLDTGGITSYVLSLAMGLQKRGHRIFVASQGGELLERFRLEGITFVPIPIRTKQELDPKILSSFFKLRAYIQEHDITLIHANTRVTQVLAQLLRNSSVLPFVSTCHGFFKPRFFRRAFGCWGDKIIAISAQVKEHLIRDFKIKEEKIEIIHNGIDAERFGQLGLQAPGSKLGAKDELGLKAGPVVGIIARLSEVKGHRYLIAAFKHVLERFTNAQLLIAGEGGLKPELMRLARSLAIDENVYFFPNSACMDRLLGAMDVFVMPSLNEGLGLALMEAMASGVAVVGSDVGGIKTLISHGQSGLLVRPGDVRGLADAIVELLSDNGKAKALAENGRDFILKNFSRDDMAARTEKVYRELLPA